MFAAICDRSQRGSGQAVSIYWGYVSLVEGSVARIRAEYGALPNVIGTGEHRLSFAAGNVVLEKANLDLIVTRSRLLAKCDPDPILSRTYSPETLKLDLGQTMIPAL